MSVSTPSRHPAQSSGGAGSSLSDLQHHAGHHPHPHQRCHGNDDEDDDDLLLSDSDDFSDHRGPTAGATAAAAVRSGAEVVDETGSRCRSPEIDVDDDDDGLIDPGGSPTVSVGVSSRSSSPDLGAGAAAVSRLQRCASGPADPDSGTAAAAPPSSSTASSDPLYHHHHSRLHAHLPPAALGLGLGVTALAAGLYHHHQQQQQQLQQQQARPLAPHHLGPPLIPPGLPFPPPPAGFAAPFQPSLYPFSPLLSFSVTSPGPNR